MERKRQQMTNNTIEELVKDITNRKGAFREKHILRNPHYLQQSETWNDEHKVIHVIDQRIDKTGHSDSYDVDLITGDICG